MHTIHVRINETYAGEARAELFHEAASAALQHENPDFPAELTLVLTSDEVLQDLNRRFLGHNAPTDVLAFPSGDGSRTSGASRTPGVSGVSSPLYLGDIAISFPRALAQSQACGHGLQSELMLLTVHGVLHLLGYDHANPARKHRMWQAQAEVLNSLGAEISGPADRVILEAEGR